MAVADREVSLVLTGNGDVLEPEDGLIGIGSGGSYALAAAKALIDVDGLAPRRSPEGHEDRRRDLRLHQRERHHRDPGTAMTALTPREIVSELDRFIVGQDDAKRAVAIALRNRWRRQQLDEALREEVLPKNILMIGPTGCGKTEIARRLAQLAQAPFLKVEATKFTEVGYVGRDVESIVRDLVEVALKLTREPPAQGGRGPGRAQRRGAGARRPGRHRGQPRDARQVPPPACATASSPTGRSTSTSRRAAARPADLRHPGHAGRPDGHAQPRRDVRQGVRATHQAQEADRGPELRGADRRGERQAARPGAGDPRGAVRHRAERHRLPRRDRQDQRPRGPRAPTSAARACSATSAPDRGHHGHHQARRGEDRPHPVHRQRRLPPQQALRTCCPSCRAACRSGSSCSRSAATTSPASWSSPRPAWSSSTRRCWAPRASRSS